MKEQTKGLILVLISTLIWGTTGIMVRFIPGIDPFTIAFFRSLFGSVTLLILIFFFKKLSNLIPKQKKIYLILLGLFMTGTVGFFIASVQLSTIANAVLLMYTAPIFVMIFSKLFLKERIKKESLIPLFLCIVGITLVFGREFQGKMFLGNIFGLLSGISWAAQMIVGRYIRKEYSGYVSGFWMNIVSVFLLFLFVSPFTVNLSILPLLVLFGIIHNGIAAYAFLEGIRFVKAQDAGIISMLDPIVNSALAFILFTEIPSTGALIGGSLILVAILIKVLSMKSE